MTASPDAKSRETPARLFKLGATRPKHQDVREWSVIQRDAAVNEEMARHVAVGERVDAGDSFRAGRPATPGTFVNGRPQRRDVLTSKANRGGIPFRIIEGLIAEAEDAGLIFRHTTGTTTGIAFANVKPTLFSSVEGEERERTHTPHTPRARVRPKAATRGK